jgi:lipoate-protein ligase A
MLAAARESGDYTIRVYSWSAPTISFGRNERTSGWYSRTKAQRANLEVVRRRTGGRALLHFKELTYAIGGPAAASDTLTAAYTQVADILVAALRQMNIRAEISDGTREENAEGAPCFATVTRGEITVDGRKLVASAQWRGDGAFLQHGSIMIQDHQMLLDNALEEGRSVSPGNSMTLEALMPPPYPGAEEFADALSIAFNERTGVAVERVAPGLLIDEDVVRKGLMTYMDPDWTWRR